MRPFFFWSRVVAAVQESGVLRADEFASIDWDSNPSRAQLTDVLRVHDFSYVQKLGERIRYRTRIMCAILVPCSFPFPVIVLLQL